MSEESRPAVLQQTSKPAVKQDPPKSAKSQLALLARAVKPKRTK